VLARADEAARPEMTAARKSVFEFDLQPKL
jgi:hypothetical protein